MAQIPGQWGQWAQPRAGRAQGALGHWDTHRVWAGIWVWVVQCGARGWAPSSIYALPTRDIL